MLAVSYQEIWELCLVQICHSANGDNTEYCCESLVSQLHPNCSANFHFAFFSPRAISTVKRAIYLYPPTVSNLRFPSPGLRAVGAVQQAAALLCLVYLECEVSWGVYLLAVIDFSALQRTAPLHWQKYRHCTHISGILLNSHWVIVLFNMQGSILPFLTWHVI